jgi:hypothetical protein
MYACHDLQRDKLDVDITGKSSMKIVLSTGPYSNQEHKSPNSGLSYIHFSVGNHLRVVYSKV